MRTLARPRAQRGEAEVVELAVVNERRLGPRADQHVEGLVHPLSAVVAPQPIADELVFVEVGPVPDPDVEAAVGKVVEERELCREADRMTQRQLDHREADPDPRGARGHHAGERDRVAVHALAREVVLGEPDAVEARRLREAGLRHLLVDGGVVGVGGRRRPERQPAEAHQAGSPSARPVCAAKRSSAAASMSGRALKISRSTPAAAYASIAALSGTSKPGGVMLISSGPSSAGREEIFAASRSALTDFCVSARSSPNPYQPWPCVTARRYAVGVRPPTTTGIRVYTGRCMACTPSNETSRPSCSGLGCVRSARIRA